MPESKLTTCNACNHNGDPCVINHDVFPDTNHTSAWGIKFQLRSTTDA